MNEELKKRISDINSGIVPEGYKKTKVGIVPEEWEVEHIGKHLQEYRELSNDIEKYPVYSSSRKGLIPQSDYYDKEAVQTNLGYKIVPVGYVTYRHMSDDDIFHFNLNSTNHDVLVSSEYPVFNAKKSADLYYIITSLNEMNRFRYFCRSQKMGGTRTRLYFKYLSTYRMAFPPLPEQQKIAEILSTQDKLIELQEKKIEQLKELKKAYLQKMFPQKGSKYPEIRFKGFTEAWEQRKFSDFTFPAGERNKDDLDLEPFAITNNQGFIAQSEAHDDFGYMKDVDRKMYIVVKPNSFAYNPARINVGSLGYYEGAENVIVSSLYEVFQTAEYVDDKFLKHWFKTKAFQDWIERLQEGSVRLYFYYDKLCECIMSMPSVEEQRKIGAYLDKIDNLITLHQREYFAFGFNSRSAKIAQITLSWEQRKLSEISEKVSKKNQDMVVDEVFTNSAEFGIISQRDYFDKDIANSENIDGYYIVEPNDFVYNPRISTLAPFGPVRRNNLDKSGAMSPLYYVFRTHDVDYGYLEYFFKTNRWHSFMHLNGNSGARSDRFAIRDEVFRDMPISMPQDIEEQKKVGDFFSALELAITLHQHKPNKKDMTF